MSRLQQGSLLRLKRKAGPDVWVFRWYEETNGTRTYRKRTIGTVARYPHLRDAEKAADALRNTINSEFAVPETIAELVTHYRDNELTEEKKAYATIEATLSILRITLFLNGERCICRMSAPWTWNCGCTLSPLPQGHGARYATSCRRYSIMPSGMNGWIGTQFQKSGLRPNGCGNRMYFRHPRLHRCWPN